MARIWLLVWVAAAVGGIVLMIVAYRDAQESLGADSKKYILFVAEKSEAKAEKGTPISVYFLPAEAAVNELTTKLGGSEKAQGRSFLRNHQEKAILFPDFHQRFNEDMLASGRLPKSGSNEVLAEQGAIHPDKITVGDRELR